MRISDWSSDVCSSDLDAPVEGRLMLLSRVDEQRLIALTRNLRRHSWEEVVDERAAQADRLEIIAAAIGGDHRDPHFGEDFEQTVVDRLAETQAAEIGRASGRERVLQDV